MMGKKRTKKTDRTTGGPTTRTTPAALNTLTDKQIIRKGDSVVRSRHELAIELIDCLIEIDRRSLYLKKGHSSLFDFCTRRWRFSPAKAGRFIASMRCIRKFPDVRVLLEERKLAICGIAAIARLVTEENRDELLRDVSGKTPKEIERIVATRRTAPSVREFIRPIGTASIRRREKTGGPEELFNDEAKSAGVPCGGNHRRAVSDSQCESGSSVRAAGDSQCESEFRGGCNVPGRSPSALAGEAGATAEKKTEERFEVRFSTDAAFVKDLERARAILSRRWSIEAVLKKTLAEFLERHDPERRAARRKRRNARKGRGDKRAAEKVHKGNAKMESAGGSAPGKSIGLESSTGANDTKTDIVEGELFPAETRAGKNALDAEPLQAEKESGDASHESSGRRSRQRSRHIPEPIRDGGRCSWTGDDGVQCGATAHLQIDHIVPFCRGGEHEPGNLRLLCGKHNRLAARELLHSG